MNNGKSPLGPLRAAVLDWAGTVVDYGCQGPTALFIETFRRYGVTLTAAEVRTYMGLKKKDHVRALLGGNGIADRWARATGRAPDENDVEKVYLDAEALMVVALKDHGHCIPGAVEAVRAMRDMGLKIGTTTGYTRPMMEVVAAAAARDGYVPDAAISSSDVPAGRPHPYMCYLNAIRLEVYPLAAMVKIGDTVADIQEGLNAGMWTIGLTRTGNELGLTEAEVRALAPDDLAARLRAITVRFHAAGAHYVVESLGNCPTIIKKINDRLALGELP